jgi:hypothetical protein
MDHLARLMATATPGGDNCHPAVTWQAQHIQIDRLSGWRFAMRERERDKGIAQAFTERDAAVAERDFILTFLREISAALNADAVAAAVQLHTLCAMVRLAEG